MGKSLEEAFPPEIAQALHANYSRCLKAGEPIAYEEEIFNEEFPKHVCKVFLELALENEDYKFADRINKLLSVER
jgi:hypothetical protein